MKKYHSPGGIRIGMRVLIYSIAFIAIVDTRETLADGTGPVSRKLGDACNKLLMASSKLGLGFALMNADHGDEDTLVGRWSRRLGITSHEAFVSAAKVDLFAR